jgi:hypothetical protein
MKGAKCIRQLKKAGRRWPLRCLGSRRKSAMAQIFPLRNYFENRLFDWNV